MRDNDGWTLLGYDVFPKSAPASAGGMLPSLAIFVFSRFALKNSAHSNEKTALALFILLLKNSQHSHKSSKYVFEHTLLGVGVLVFVVFWTFNQIHSLYSLAHWFQSCFRYLNIEVNLFLTTSLQHEEKDIFKTLDYS